MGEGERKEHFLSWEQNNPTYYLYRGSSASMRLRKFTCSKTPIDAKGRIRKKAKKQINRPGKVNRSKKNVSRLSTRKR